MYGPGDVGFFDRVAPLYDRLMPAARAGALSAGLGHARRPLGRAVDLGGGTGRAAAALRGATSGGGSAPLVVDASRGMLPRARTRGLDALAGDAARLPIRDGAVDAVTIVDALHHFPDRRAALSEAARILAPGGVLVVREFDPRHPLGAVLAAAERAIGMGSSFVGPDALARQVRAAGLEPAVPDRGFGYTVVGIAPGSADDEPGE